MGKRQVSFFIDNEIYKEFSKKCIDLNKSKTQIFTDLIKKFLNK